MTHTAIIKALPVLSINISIGVFNLIMYFSIHSDKDDEILQSLLRTTEHVRQSTSQTRRIQRGSPGAGTLGIVVQKLQNEVAKIKPRVEEILELGSSNEQHPYFSLIHAQFTEFVSVLHEPFNDGGNEPGYSERVMYLERLMYVTGTLRGSLQLFFEQSKYLRVAASTASASPSAVVLPKRLVFEDVEVIASDLDILQLQSNPSVRNVRPARALRQHLTYPSPPSCSPAVAAIPCTRGMHSCWSIIQCKLLATKCL